MDTNSILSATYPATPPTQTYCGYRGPKGLIVRVDSMDHNTHEFLARDLPVRLDLRNHSPTGFEWGYGGSGPSQLSLALLADFTQDDAYACALYQDLKWDVVCELPEQGWEITGDALQDWVERHPMESTPEHPLE